MQTWNKHQNIINKNILNRRNESQVPNWKKYFGAHTPYGIIGELISIEFFSNVHLSEEHYCID